MMDDEDDEDERPTPAREKIVGDRETRRGGDKERLAFGVREIMATPKMVVVGTKIRFCSAAEQFGLKVVNLEKVKPSPDALQIVPDNGGGLQGFAAEFARQRTDGGGERSVGCGGLMIKEFPGGEGRASGDRAAARSTK